MAKLGVNAGVPPGSATLLAPTPANEPLPSTVVRGAPVARSVSAVALARPGLDGSSTSTDQLSAAAGLDRYRIQSLDKLLSNENLSPQQTRAAAAMLQEKCRIYASGCRKRGRNKEAQLYDALAAKHRIGAEAQS